MNKGSQSIINGIKSIYKIFGKNVSTGITFFDNYMIAEKDSIIVRIILPVKVVTPFTLSMAYAIMIKDMDGSDLVIESSDNQIKFSSSNRSYKFDFDPPKPREDIRLGNPVITLDFETFKDKVVPVLPILNYPFQLRRGSIGNTALFSDGKTLDVFATNGACLILNRMKCDSNFKLCVDKNIDKIFKLDYSGNVIIYKHKYYTVFVMGSCEIYLSSKETTELDYSKCLTAEKSMSVDRDQLQGVILRFLEVGLLPVRVIGSGQYLIMSIKSGNNAFYERIVVNECSCVDGFSFILHPKYLKVALKAIKSHKITIKYTENSKYITLSDKDTICALAGVQQKKIK